MAEMQPVLCKVCKKERANRFFQHPESGALLLTCDTCAALVIKRVKELDEKRRRAARAVLN